MYSSFVFAQVAEPVNYQQQQLSDLVVLSEQLAQEVRELRGIVEQQSYDLRKIQQQRLDDYRNLDKRIAGLGESANVSPTVVSTPADINTVAVVNTVDAPVLSEKETYRQAYTLVKNRDFDNAVPAFQQFLEQYPDGNYAGNAFYWLGELYDLSADYSNAQKSMMALIVQFPQHRKIADAHYKLAKVFHKMGDADKAQEHANIVIDQFSSSGATTVKLAQAFLANNYP